MMPMPDRAGLEPADILNGEISRPLPIKSFAKLNTAVVVLQSVETHIRYPTVSPYITTFTVFPFIFCLLFYFAISIFSPGRDCRLLESGHLAVLPIRRRTSAAGSEKVTHHVLYRSQTGLWYKSKCRSFCAAAVAESSEPSCILQVLSQVRQLIWGIMLSTYCLYI